LPTVTAEHRNDSATKALVPPSAHPRTIFERNAKACVDFARRDQRTNCSRSLSVSVNSALGRPVLAILHFNI
jgi:hypothetical protein